ncbi:hypothetical protein JaAD80_14740 [Janthinobacterium sp. AD80]|nr:hypothetical protein JaAD80_14740 [Janthinobacterium sp. AD80]
MDVHSVGFLENWGFGDFQCLKSNPNEPQQPIETSHLVALTLDAWRLALALPCLALAWLGLAWLGLAWLGLAWLGLAGIVLPTPAKLEGNHGRRTIAPGFRNRARKIPAHLYPAVELFPHSHLRTGWWQVAGGRWQVAGGWRHISLARDRWLAIAGMAGPGSTSRPDRLQLSATPLQLSGCCCGSQTRTLPSILILTWRTWLPSRRDSVPQRAARLLVALQPRPAPL